LRVFENRVLRGIFGIEEEVTEERLKLPNNKLHNVQSSHHQILLRVIKSRRLSLVMHQENAEGMGNAYQNFTQKT
jgi:hypothetical protein